MDAKQLIAEGRRLQRPQAVLVPEGTGVPAAYWLREDSRRGGQGFQPWMTIRASAIPGCPAAVQGYLTVLINTDNMVDGKVEISTMPPPRYDTALYVKPVLSLPPLMAVAANGTPAVLQWLQAANCSLADCQNLGFPACAAVEDYEDLWIQEDPFYAYYKDYGTLGGWHFPWPDGDWINLRNEHLLGLTFRNSEPWVEVWWTQQGQFRVFQRIT